MDCCKYFASNNSFCPHDKNDCKSCDISVVNIPWEEYFLKYFNHFMNDNPDSSCSKGGHAAYSGVSKKGDVYMKT